MAFFTTRGGNRVRSAAGGRTYSAVTTVDGRVFKWGIRRTATEARGNGSSRDEEGVEDRGDGPSEEDGVCVVEASVPRQVAGLGMEVSDSMWCSLRRWLVCHMGSSGEKNSACVAKEAREKFVKNPMGETNEERGRCDSQMQVWVTQRTSWRFMKSSVTTESSSDTLR